MLKNKIRLSVIAMTALGASLFAGEETTLGAISVFANKLDEFESFKNPMQIETIGGVDKNMKATNSLGAALSDIAGINNISTGPQAGKPSIRGMTGDRVKILSNSSPTDFQTYGGRHIANIDLFLSDKIEVIRGAQSALYGSDALGGIVNIVSPSILSTKEGSYIANGEALAEYGVNNSEKAYGVKLKSAAGKLGLNIGLSTRSAGDYKTPNKESYTPSSTSGDLPRFTGRLPYTNFETNSALIGAGYTNEWGKVALQHIFWQSRQNYLGHTSVSPYNATPSAGQKLTNDETQFKAVFFAGDWEIKPSFSKTRNDREAATNATFENMDSKKGSADYLDISVDRDDFKLAITHPVIGAFKGEIGVEYMDKNQELKEGSLSPSADESGKSIYIFEEAKIGDYLLQAAARYESKNIKAPLVGKNGYFTQKGIFDASNNDKDFSAIAGSIGISYDLHKNWSLSANLSRGFRSPSIFELFAGGIHGGVQAYQIGNPNLKEEISTGGELSLKFKNQKSKFTFNVYQTKVNDFIYIQNTGYYRSQSGVRYDTNGAQRVAEMQNMQTDALIRGLEFGFDAKIFDFTSIDGKLELIKGYDLKNDRRLPMIAPANAKIAVHHDVGKIWAMKKNIFSADISYSAAQSVSFDKEPFAQYNSTPFGTADTKAYTLFGLHYKGAFELLNKEAQLGIKVSNLFDNGYIDYLDTYKGYALGMGRNISFTLSMQF